MSSLISRYELKLQDNPKLSLTPSNFAMKTIIIAGLIGCVAAFLILTSAMTGLSYAVTWNVIILSLILLVIAAWLTASKGTATRLGVALGLSLPPVLLLVDMVREVLSEGRGFTWQLLALACVVLAASFAGAWGSYYLSRSR